MGKVDGNSTFNDNDLEEVRYKSDTKIKEWIDKQLAMRSCLVVLVGYETSERKWVKYEIEKAMEYADENVQHLFGHFPTKARHYVDEIEKLLAAEEHIFYGEHDGEDLSDWSEDEIWQELKDRIFPTTITIVLICPNMKKDGKYDKSQWIPWEICYSLRETVRSDMKSHRNAILAVVLPDKQGNYEYALKSNTCCERGCTTYIRDWMFTIIKENLFNRKHPNIVDCQNNTRI